MAGIVHAHSLRNARAAECLDEDGALAEHALMDIAGKHRRLQRLVAHVRSHPGDAYPAAGVLAALGGGLPPDAARFGSDRVEGIASRTSDSVPSTEGAISTIELMIIKGMIQFTIPGQRLLW